MKHLDMLIYLGTLLFGAVLFFFVRNVVSDTTFKAIGTFFFIGLALSLGIAILWLGHHIFSNGGIEIFFGLALGTCGLALLILAYYGITQNIL